MPLKNLQTEFIDALSEIYEKQEANNIFHLVIETLSAINFKKNETDLFKLDGRLRKIFAEIVSRLKNHEPIQYILKEAWFYDIPFYVDKHVLIPRPETEELVNWVIKDNINHGSLFILDIGTGSGCIPIILKRKIPNATVYSCDVSAQALDIAKRNSLTYNTNISFLHLDFLQSNNWPQIPKMDIIVSNPPYIPESDKKEMHENVLTSEPHLALFVPNKTPLLFYEKIAKAGHSLLKEHGLIYVEIHERFANQASAIFTNLDYDTIIKKDMQDKPRMIKASLIVKK